MPLILAVFIVCCLLPSVLWRCWLGGRKGIRPVKKLSGWMLMQLSVWSKVQTCIWPSWCHCHSLSLASVKSRLVQPFWCRLTWVVLEKGPLNGCVCVCVIVCCLSEIMLSWDEMVITWCQVRSVWRSSQNYYFTGIKKPWDRYTLCSDNAGDYFEKYMCAHPSLFCFK